MINLLWGIKYFLDVNSIRVDSINPKFDRELPFKRQRDLYPLLDNQICGFCCPELVEWWNCDKTDNWVGFVGISSLVRNSCICDLYGRWNCKWQGQVSVTVHSTQCGNWNLWNLLRKRTVAWQSQRRDFGVSRKSMLCTYMQNPNLPNSSFSSLFNPLLPHLHAVKPYFFTICRPSLFYP